MNTVKSINESVKSNIARLNEARRLKNAHKIIWATVHGVPFKLNNNVSVKIFNNVSEIFINQALNEKSYFNTAWFEKRGIKVTVNAKISA